jgi:hypothetical protein
MNLFDEFRLIVTELDNAGIAYAVCGGMAMAAYGHARATQDIDLLIASSAVDDALKLLTSLGYWKSSRLAMNKGRVRVIRTIKVVADEHLIVDILEAPDAGEEAWANRHCLETEIGPVWFVSREGLVAMKRSSGRLQDLADIERLEGDSACP